MFRTLMLAASIGALGAPVMAQTTNIAGGAAGADMSLEAISPESEAVSVGLAGDSPADIARFLLASGAGGGQISPDGSQIAFSSRVTGINQLWIVEAEGGQPRQLTFGNGITFFRWAPDGSGLLYGADNDGNERPAYYMISADGRREFLALAATENGFRSFGDFAGDANTIVYASTERNGLDFDVYLAEIDGAEPQILFEGVFGYFARTVAPSGEKVIVTETVGEDSDNLYLLRLTNGEIYPISTPEPRANHGDGGFAWRQDGSGFYLATNRDREFSALSFYDMASGEIQTIAAADADAGNVSLCGEDDRWVVWTTNHDGFSQLNAMERVSGDRLDVPDLPEGVYGVDCSTSSSRVALTINGWRTPGALRVWDMDSGEVFESFNPNLAGLDARRLVRPESVRITARDGVELQGLLYLPEGASAANPAPLLMEVHGGPTAQSRASWDAIVQYHVNRGVAVFEPNVRGSTGFGRTYTTLDDQENRLDSIRDLVDMLAHFEGDARIDASRAAVSGGSYGGYAVNAVLANFPGHFIAGVSRYGVADWVTALEVASPALKAADRIEYGDITEQRWQDFYTEQSPIRQADQIDVPVLYSHGVMDPRIDIAETEVMVRTLRENGIDAPYIRIPDEGHGWRKLSNQLFYYRRQAEFIEQQLGVSADD